MGDVTCKVEIFPIAGRFAISRGAKTEARVVVATITEGTVSGRGECVPYARYGESVENTVAAIESVAAEIGRSLDRQTLQRLLPAGAARNAIDCALWDLEAKRARRSVADLIGVAAPRPVTTAFTISVDNPGAMAAAAAKAAGRSLLKIKLAGGEDQARLAAVRAAAPNATLIVDANEAWMPSELESMIAACAETGVALIEQPLPAGDDAALAHVPHRVPVCADESMHDRRGLAALRDRYDAVNIKLDKTGGLTEALAVASEAAAIGFDIMVGCMVGTSLAMAPAMLLTRNARFVDLDGPLILAADRPNGLVYEGSKVHPPTSDLWG